MIPRHGLPLECKFAHAATGEFAGLASTFGGPPDHVGDIVAPGAFAESLAKHERQGTTPAMLWSHVPSEPVGTWKSFRESGLGLEVAGALTLEVERAREAHALAKAGAVALSIGYITKTSDFDREGHRVLREVDLLEVSLVAIPANHRARITEVKSARPQDIRSFEAALRDACGFSVRDARKLASGGWRALDSQDDELVAALRALAVKHNAI